MEKRSKFAMGGRWALAIVLAALHPIFLYYLTPIYGLSANLIVFIAPVAATLMFGWRVGLFFIPVNVVATAVIFGKVFHLEGAAEGRPKAVFSAIILAIMCLGADKLRDFMRQRKRMTEELRRASKMEAIGRLAGGVAHDMNNTLNAIMGSVFAHRQELSGYRREFKDLENIAAACDRGAQLTQNLLGFARKGSLKAEVFSLNRIMQGAELLLRRTASKNINIVSSLASPAPYMEGDRGEVENAVMNLCLNALDAMGDNGTLTLKTGYDRKKVFLKVSDTGEGMDRSVQEHVFEPFFTTKEEGKGTGLGLAIVYGAVHSMKGKITLESAPGRGTDITLTFPARSAEQAVGPAPVLPPVSADTLEVLTGRTVVIADDEPLVLRAGTRMLKTLGCEVISVGSGEDAVAAVEKNGDEISLVIVDLVMPGLDGVGTMEKILEIEPDMPLILVSGYTKDAFKGRDFEAHRDSVKFLAKPYRPEQLSRVARCLLTDRKKDRDSRSSSA